jgi:hypothetical protein
MVKQISKLNASLVIKPEVGILMRSPAIGKNPETILSTFIPHNPFYPASF